MAEEIKELTPSGRIKRPAYSTVAKWIEKAWKDIDTILIQRSFKCCGISNARDSSEDDLIFDYDRVIENKQRSNNYIFENTEIGSNSSESLVNFSTSKLAEVFPGDNVVSSTEEEIFLDDELKNDSRNENEVLDYYENEVTEYVNFWN
jgi:hypothetical protein